MNPGPSGARHRVTLQFLDPALERDFQMVMASEELPRTRRAFLLADVLWGIGGLILPFVARAHLYALEGIILGVAMSNLSALAMMRGAPSFGRQQNVLTIVNGVASLGVVALIAAADPDVYMRYGPASIMLTTLFVQLAVFMRFRSALLTSIPVIVGYIVLVAVRSDGGAVAMNAFFALSTFALVAASAYTLEKKTREVFFQRRVIEAQGAALEREKEKSDRLLLNVLPRSIAANLRERHEAIAEEFESATVLFADIVGFTKLAARITAAELVAMLNELFTRFDDLAERHGLEKIKTIGDAYMVVGGVPERRDDHATAVAAMGLDMLAAVEGYAREHGVQLGVRVGIHTGTVVAGVIGKKKFAYDLWGDTVNTASRMESHGTEGKVQVSEATSEKLRGVFEVTARGEIPIKGKGEMRTYFLVGRAAAEGAPVG